MKVNFKSTWQQIILALIIAVFLLLISLLISVKQGKNDIWSIANNGNTGGDSGGYSEEIGDEGRVPSFDLSQCFDCGYNFMSYGFPFTFLDTFEGGEGGGGYTVQPNIVIDFVIYFFITFIVIRLIIFLKTKKRKLTVKH